MTRLYSFIFLFISFSCAGKQNSCEYITHILKDSWSNFQKISSKTETDLSKISTHYGYGSSKEYISKIILPGASECLIDISKESNEFECEWDYGDNFEQAVAGYFNLMQTIGKCKSTFQGVWDVDNYVGRGSYSIRKKFEVLAQDVFEGKLTERAAINNQALNIIELNTNDEPEKYFDFTYERIEYIQRGTTRDHSIRVKIIDIRGSYFLYFSLESFEI
ncbi:hypothetical protein [Thalassotalea crassostreae]|uniref:hypothetical protein n=1 Tax=Thalassotalea crassostreae TaxID=1763536 RepID=UPI000837ECD6|nr:hypothetical protein [Thalassotalea crassostreae]